MYILVTTREFIYLFFIYFSHSEIFIRISTSVLSVFGGVWVFLGGGGTYIRHVCEVCFYFKYVYCRFS